MSALTAQLPPPPPPTNAVAGPSRRDWEEEERKEDLDASSSSSSSSSERVDTTEAGAAGDEDGSVVGRGGLDSLGSKKDELSEMIEAMQNGEVDESQLSKSEGEEDSEDDDDDEELSLEERERRLSLISSSTLDQVSSPLQFVSFFVELRHAPSTRLRFELLVR